MKACFSYWFFLFLWVQKSNSSRHQSEDSLTEKSAADGSVQMQAEWSRVRGGPG